MVPLRDRLENCIASHIVGVVSLLKHDVICDCAYVGVGLRAWIASLHAIKH